MLICDDNLRVMQAMKPSTLQMIYCDVLYNTRQDFGDYNDDLGTPKQAHEFYAPRFDAMHRLLVPSGTLFIQADWHLIHYLKVWLDDVFGFDNFINEIIWCYTGGNSTKAYKRKHDTILVYGKTKTPKYTPQRAPYNDKLLKSTQLDDHGRRYYKTGQNAIGRVYLNDEGQQLYDYWVDIPSFTSASGSKELTGYATQKPEKLLQRVIATGTDPGDVIGDFFCGSGTTLAVAQKMQRRFIGCDINPQAIAIASSRLGIKPSTLHKPAPAPAPIGASVVQSFDEPITR